MNSHDFGIGDTVLVFQNSERITPHIGETGKVIGHVNGDVIVRFKNGTTAFIWYVDLKLVKKRRVFFNWMNEFHTESWKESVCSTGSSNRLVKHNIQKGT
mgnify:CR=1 FL=1